MAGGAPEISLGQKYLTTADPFDPNYNTPDLHRDLKKLTCPSVHSFKTTCYVRNSLVMSPAIGIAVKMIYGSHSWLPMW